MVYNKIYNKPTIVIAFFLYLASAFIAMDVNRYGFKVGLVEGIFLFIEFFFLSLVLFYFQNRRKLYWFYLFFVVIGCILTVQYLALKNSREFISILALENTGRIHEIMSSKVLSRVIVRFSVFLVFLGVLIHSPVRQMRIRPVIFILSVCLYFAANATSLHLLYEHNKTPLYSFVDTFYVYKSSSVGSSVVNEFKGNPYFYFNENSEFPFQKNVVYGKGAEFIPETSVPLNVITIFTEGASSRMYHCYGGKFSDLTPHIDRFAADSMVVKNYYNHTAATYRGIPGQLTSTYPYYGWNENPEQTAQTNYIGIPDILKKKGYETIFFHPHHEKDVLADILKKLNFDKVFSAQQIVSDLLKRDEKGQEDSVRDEVLFEGIMAYLKARKSSQPFYIGVYNVETHAFMDTAEDGIKYKNGKNSVLNNIHNFDIQFGKFYDFLKKNGYLKNTIVILTADHAHFYEPKYLELQDETYQKVFVDAIPLIIKAPFEKAPKVYDAQYRTSIDYAPTLLNLLNINDAANSFLGHSIFDENSMQMGLASFSKLNYIIKGGRVYEYSDLEMSEKSKARQYLSYVKTFYQYELKNKVFQEAID